MAIIRNADGTTTVTGSDSASGGSTTYKTGTTTVVSSSGSSGSSGSGSTSSSGSSGPSTPQDIYIVVGDEGTPSVSYTVPQGSSFSGLNPQATPGARQIATSGTTYGYGGYTAVSQGLSGSTSGSIVATNDAQRQYQQSVMGNIYRDGYSLNVSTGQYERPLSPGSSITVTKPQYDYGSREALISEAERRGYLYTTGYETISGEAPHLVPLLDRRGQPQYDSSGKQQMKWTADTTTKAPATFAWREGTPATVKENWVQAMLRTGFGYQSTGRTEDEFVVKPVVSPTRVDTVPSVGTSSDMAGFTYRKGGLYDAEGRALMSFDNKLTYNKGMLYTLEGAPLASVDNSLKYKKGILYDAEGRPAASTVTFSDSPSYSKGTTVELEKNYVEPTRPTKPVGGWTPKTAVAAAAENISITKATTPEKDIHPALVSSNGKLEITTPATVDYDIWQNRAVQPEASVQDKYTRGEVPYPTKETEAYATRRADAPTLDKDYGVNILMLDEIITNPGGSVDRFVGNVKHIDVIAQHESNPILAALAMPSYLTAQVIIPVMDVYTWTTLAGRGYKAVTTGGSILAKEGLKQGAITILKQGVPAVLEFAGSPTQIVTRFTHDPLIITNVARGTGAVVLGSMLGEATGVYKSEFGKGNIDVLGKFTRYMTFTSEPGERTDVILSSTIYNLPYSGISYANVGIPGTAKSQALNTAYIGLNVLSLGILTAKNIDQAKKDMGVGGEGFFEGWTPDVVMRGLGRTWGEVAVWEYGVEGQVYDKAWGESSFVKSAQAKVATFTPAQQTAYYKMMSAVDAPLNIKPDVGFMAKPRGGSYDMTSAKSGGVTAKSIITSYEVKPTSDVLSATSGKAAYELKPIGDNAMAATSTKTTYDIKSGKNEVVLAKAGTSYEIKSGYDAKVEIKSDTHPDLKPDFKQDWHLDVKPHVDYKPEPEVPTKPTTEIPTRIEPPPPPTPTPDYEYRFDYRSDYKGDTKTDIKTDVKYDLRTDIFDPAALAMLPFVPTEGGQGTGHTARSSMTRLPGSVLDLLSVEMGAKSILGKRAKTAPTFAVVTTKTGGASRSRSSTKKAPSGRGPGRPKGSGKKESVSEMKPRNSTWANEALGIFKRK